MKTVGRTGGRRAVSKVIMLRKLSMPEVSPGAALDPECPRHTHRLVDSERPHHTYRLVRRDEGLRAKN